MQPELAWAFQTGDPIRSTPTVWNDRVIVGSVDHSLYCLSADDGRLVWQFATDGPINGPSARIADGRVFIGSDDEMLYCLEADNGRPVWTFPTQRDFQEPVVLHSGMVFVSDVDRFLYCLKQADGCQVWKIGKSDLFDARPRIDLAAAQDSVLISLGGGILYCLSARQGTVLWKLDCDLLFESFLCVIKEFCYVSCFMHFCCLRRDTGEIVWESASEAPILDAPGVSEKRVFVADVNAILYCANRETGRLIWRSQFGTFGEMLFVSTKSHDGHLFVGSYDDHLYCLDEETGSVIWRFEVPDAIGTKPTVWKDRVFFGCDDGKLYCVRWK